MLSKLVNVLVVLVFSCAVFGAFGQNSFEAYVPEETVSALLDHPINISCSTPSKTALQSCRWERIPPPTNYTHYYIHLKAQNNGGGAGGGVDSSESSCKNCSYKYIGNGLDQGDCAISILNVSEFHIAQWQCLLVDKNKNDTTWLGNLTISKNKAIKKPYFANREAREQSVFEIVYNETSPSSTNFSCCVDDCDPTIPLSINVFLGHHSGGKSRRDEVNSFSGRGKQACRHAGYLFSPEDNRRLIMCNATYLYHDRRIEQITSAQLNVKFAPKLFPDNQSQTLDSSKVELTITAFFISNPRANVEWSLISDKETNRSFVISPNHVKYKQEVRQIETDKFITQLIIQDFVEEDYSRMFKLQVSNQFGRDEMLINIVSPPPGGAADAYWIMIVIGIGAIVLIILISVVVYITLTKPDRRRGQSYQAAPVKISKPNEERRERRIQKQQETEGELVEESTL